MKNEGKLTEHKLNKPRLEASHASLNSRVYSPETELSEIKSGFQS